MGIYDPTEIHNRGLLKRHMKEAMIKLGCHAINFFLFLYRYCVLCLNVIFLPKHINFGVLMYKVHLDKSSVMYKDLDFGKF